MKIKLFTVPNILTLSNLFCGSVALIEIFLYQNFFAASMLILASATFDFLDGLAARLLGAYSEVGRELDSLADVVSFGLVPSMFLFTLFNMAEKHIDNPVWGKWGAVIPLLMVCFSALRLAKFNVDESQESCFEGLPTPANALFCMSLGMLMVSGKITLSGEAIAAISAIMAYLLISPMRFFALKFRSLAWRENRVRYIFLLLSAAAILFMRDYALPTIVAIYILVSAVSNIIEGAKRAKNSLNE